MFCYNYVQMAEQLLTCGQVFEDELVGISFSNNRADIGVALLANSCM